MVYYLKVSTNGIVSFGAGVWEFTPYPFPLNDWKVICPFWADVDTKRNDGRIYYRESTGKGHTYKQLKQKALSATTARIFCSISNGWFQEGRFCERECCWLFHSASVWRIVKQESISPLYATTTAASTVTGYTSVGNGITSYLRSTANRIDVFVLGGVGIAFLDNSPIRLRGI